MQKSILAILGILLTASIDGLIQSATANQTPQPKIESAPASSGILVSTKRCTQNKYSRPHHKK